MSGLLAGLCIGGALVAILWEQVGTWRGFLRFEIAALGIVLGIWFLR